MEKYYFISYQWYTGQTWLPGNVVTTKSPMKWLRDSVENETERHRIVFYSMITKAEYDLVNGYIL